MIKATLKYLLLCCLPVHSQGLLATTWTVNGSNNSAAQTATKNITATIQAAVDKAVPGDAIQLMPGVYFEDFHSVRNGLSDKPITIRGVRESIIKGSGQHSHVIDINHDYIHLIGFSIDGLTGDAKVKRNYRNKLIYVHGRIPSRGIQGILIDTLDLRNAGGECLRLRYFVSDSEIRNTHFTRCGVFDFAFRSSKKNGEGIYLGTSSTQWGDGKNPTAEPDRSANNWIHHNTFETWGNECVDIKEGAERNIVEYNICEQQLDPKSAGFDARGDNNIFRFNTVRGNSGSGFRLGGHKVRGRQYGLGNQVYGNAIENNAGGAIKIMATPQGQICGNHIHQTGTAILRGAYIQNIHPQASCP